MADLGGGETTRTHVMAHGVGPRGLESTPASSSFAGRFGRMFRNLPVFGVEEAALEQLAARMTVDVELTPTPTGGWASPDGVSFDHPELPAGYTYLGQFIDHDITFDPTSSLDRQNDPDGLHSFRTPRFDLDSLYGRGPADQPYLYQRASDPIPVPGSDADGRGVLLLEGIERNQGSPLPGRDVPRNSQQVALIGDPRNDENIIVSQLHSLFIRFHNRVVAEVAASTGLRGDDLFKEAQRLVRWHYQWIVVHDFLPRIVWPEVAADVLGTESYVTSTGEVTLRRANLQFYRPHDHAYMPVEFSVAAYRFGHSLVRPAYFINNFVTEQSGGPTPLFSDDTADIFANLNGNRELPPEWGFDWSLFFDLGTGGPVQRTLKFDTRLATPLGALPGTTGLMRSLAHRNLLRGVRMGLPSGQTVARTMGVQPLGDDVLGITDLSPSFANNAPLWFYVLKEAEVLQNGERLGPVGGRIVAEVLVGLLAADRLSFLNVEPNWQPTLGGGGVANMASLITYNAS